MKKNIEASVRALLQNKAKENNYPFSEIQQYINPGSRANDLQTVSFNI